MGHFIEEIYQVLTALTNYILIAASTCTSLQFGVVSKYRTLQREPGEAHTTSPESLRDTKWLETSFLCFVIQVYAGTPRGSYSTLSCHRLARGALVLSPGRLLAG